MGQLLVVRHGQASFGAADYDALSDLGRVQAGLVAERLAPLGVRRVVSGGLRRQRDTAAAVAAAAGVPVEVDPRWDEYDADDLVARLAPVDPDELTAAATDSRAFQQLLDRAQHRWTGGADDADYRESWPAFRSRVVAALHALTGGSGTTVAVTSAGAVGVVAAELLGLDARGWGLVTRVQVNAAVTRVVSGRSGVSLVSLNDHAHLEAAGADHVTYR